MANAGRIRAGKAFVELVLDDKIQAGLKRAQRRLDRFGARVGQIGKSLALVGTAVVGALGGAAKVFASTGDQLEKMSRRTGFTVEQLSQLSFVASQNSVSLEGMNKSIRKMQRAIVDAGDGLTTYTRAFDKLGISVADLEGRDPVEQFAMIGKALQNMEDPTVRAGVALQIFGRSAETMLQVFSDAATPIDQLIKRAKELGIVIDGKAAKSAVALTDAMDELFSVLKMIVFTIGGSIAPIFTDIAKQMAEAGSVAAGWISENKDLVVSLLKLGGILIGIGSALIVTAVAIKGVALAFGVLASAVGLVSGLITGLITVLGFLISPIGLMIAGFAAAAGTILAFTDSGNMALKGFGKTAKDTFDGIADALKSGDITLAGKILFASLKALWADGVFALSSIWSEIVFNFQSSLASISGVFEDVWNGIATFFGSIVDGIKEGFKTVVDSAEKAAEKTAEFFGEYVGPSGFIEEEKERQRERGRAAIEEIKSGINAVLPGLDLFAEKRTLTGKIEVPSFTELAEMQRDADVASARRERDERKSELVALRRQAGAQVQSQEFIKRFEKVLPTGLSFTPDETGSELTSAFSDATDKLGDVTVQTQQTANEVVGGFRLDLSGLGLGTSIQQQQLDKLDQIKKSNDRIEDNTRESGLVLG